MKTYQEVADKVFGEGISMVSDRFVNYMKARWASSEEEKCLTGYAEEWARRFRVGQEFYYSDSEGRKVLQAI